MPTFTTALPTHHLSATFAAARLRNHHLFLYLNSARRGHAQLQNYKTGYQKPTRHALIQVSDRTQPAAGHRIAYERLQPIGARRHHLVDLEDVKARKSALIPMNAPHIPELIAARQRLIER